MVLIIEYPNEGISFLVGFGRVVQCPSHVKRYVMETYLFLGYFERGITRSLSLFGHEQYPFNYLDQNNSAHGFYSVAQ
jgi:hypothetical protein